MGIRFRLKERIADYEYRTRKVLMLKDIAAATGVHAVTLSKLYTNKELDVRLSTIERLCGFFGCSFGDLVEYDPEREAAGE
jgi:putative transcriptional regulator